jgi:hypothetical protein
MNGDEWTMKNDEYDKTNDYNDVIVGVYSGRDGAGEHQNHDEAGSEVRFGVREE